MNGRRAKEARRKLKTLPFEPSDRMAEHKNRRIQQERLLNGEVFTYTTSTVTITERWFYRHIKAVPHVPAL